MVQRFRTSYINSIAPINIARVYKSWNKRHGVRATGDQTEGLIKTGRMVDENGTSG
jgi:hypothetical protein